MLSKLTFNGIWWSYLFLDKKKKNYGMFTSEHEEPSKRGGCFIWGKYLHRVKYNKYITCNIYIINISM